MMRAEKYATDPTTLLRNVAMTVACDSTSQPTSSRYGPSQSLAAQPMVRVASKATMERSFILPNGEKGGFGRREIGTGNGCNGAFLSCWANLWARGRNAVVGGDLRRDAVPCRLVCVPDR
jgi:hypothetical protein